MDIHTHFLHDAGRQKLPQRVIQEVEVPHIGSGVVQEFWLQGELLPYLQGIQQNPPDSVAGVRAYKSMVEQTEGKRYLLEGKHRHYCRTGLRFGY